MPVTLVLAEMEGERVRERVVRILQPAAFKAFDFQGAIWKIIPELGGGAAFLKDLAPDHFSLGVFVETGNAVLTVKKTAKNMQAYYGIINISPSLSASLADSSETNKNQETMQYPK